MRVRLVWSILVLCWAGAATARAQNTVDRYVEFRDGSVLKLPVVDEKWTVSGLGAEGQIEKLDLKLSELEHLTLTADSEFQKKGDLLKAIQNLGSDDFQQREKAHADLIKMGPAFRPDLELFLELSGDKEVVA